MQPADVHALSSGTVPGEDEGSEWTLTVHDLGTLRVPSGRLEASDPYVFLGEGVVTAVEPGRYPVKVTVADVSAEQDGSHLREAYLSVVIGDGEVTRVELSDQAVPVDAGTVGFADQDAVARCIPADLDRYEELFDTDRPDSWFDLMDSPDHFREGAANIVLPNAPDGENVVLCHSGWGDGVYPVLATYDAADRLLGVHIDLLVVGSLDPEEDEDESAADAPGRSGLWAKVKGIFGR